MVIAHSPSSTSERLLGAQGETSRQGRQARRVCCIVLWLIGIAGLTLTLARGVAMAHTSAASRPPVLGGEVVSVAVYGSTGNVRVPASGNGSQGGGSHGGSGGGGSHGGTGHGSGGGSGAGRDGGASSGSSHGDGRTTSHGGGGRADHGGGGADHDGGGPGNSEAEHDAGVEDDLESGNVAGRSARDPGSVGRSRPRGGHRDVSGDEPDKQGVHTDVSPADAGGDAQAHRPPKINLGSGGATPPDADVETDRGQSRPVLWTSPLFRLLAGAVVPTATGPASAVMFHPRVSGFVPRPGWALSIWSVCRRFAVGCAAWTSTGPDGSGMSWGAFAGRGSSIHDNPGRSSGSDSSDAHDGKRAGRESHRPLYVTAEAIGRVTPRFRPASRLFSPGAEIGRPESIPILNGAGASGSELGISGAGGVARAIMLPLAPPSFPPLPRSAFSDFESALTSMYFRPHVRPG